MRNQFCESKNTSRLLQMYIHADTIEWAEDGPNNWSTFHLGYFIHIQNDVLYTSAVSITDDISMLKINIHYTAQIFSLNVECLFHTYYR